MHHVTHRSHEMRKQKFGITCPEALFVKSVPAPPDIEKYCVDDSLPGRTEMHYVTRRSHRMQKQKFSVTCPDVLFLKSVLVPPEHEKECVDVLSPRRIGMHYVTHRSLRMQKNRSLAQCVLKHFLSNPYWSHPSKKNSASTFRAPDAPNALRDVQIPLDAKTKIQRNVPQHHFCGICTSPTRA
jgi:hypothetical protein